MVQRELKHLLGQLQAIRHHAMTGELLHEVTLTMKDNFTLSESESHGTKLSS
jgi:hypothetical protein